MAGTSVSSYGTQCGVECLWHRMDVLLRVDVAVLGLLLACTLVLVVRVSRCYRLARDRGIDSPAGKVVVAELKANVGNLKSIASTATYFGLLGTCLGILSAFSPAGMEKHTYAAWMMSKMTAALVPCAVGIIVAVPATCGHTYGCMRLDLLAKGLPKRNRLLTRRFEEFPSFAVITTAWLLTILLRVYALPFTPVHTSKGLDVGIASVPCDTSDRFIVLRISDRGGIFLNFQEQQDWTGLQNGVSEIYRMRAHRVLYLSADEGVSYQTVADAIDTVRSAPEDITVQLVRPRAVNAGCPGPHLAGSSVSHPSR
jgi:biopolymer transport protein ExbD